MNILFGFLLIVAVFIIGLVCWHAVWAVFHGRQHLEIQERFNQATAPKQSSSRTG